VEAHIFEGKEAYGLTVDPNGANLPSEGGPWDYWKSIKLEQGEKGRIGLDSDTAIAQLTSKGYCIISIKIEVAGGAG
jgi:hypothetical protein